jgi:hypothetical protein
MKQYQEIQKEGMEYYVKFAEGNPKALLSALIVDSMLNDPAVDLARVKKIYASFSSELKSYKPGKSIKSKFNHEEKSKSWSWCYGIQDQHENIT